MAFLRELDADAEDLLAFRECADARDRQRLFLWRREHDVSHNVVQCLDHMTPHKFMRYAEQQKRRHGGQRYLGMQSVVTEYRDYLDMCAKLGYDLDNSFVLYPKNLRDAHDRAARRVKARADAKMRRDFRAAMRAIAGHLDFQMDGMKIVLPATPDEIIAEGHALHHCVGGYVDRVARHECIILFLRQCGNESTLFYTMEIRNRRAVQVRGLRNCDPTPEVRKFVDRFEQRVLQAA